MPPDQNVSTPSDLVGPRMRLRVLRPTDGPALANAAADGELWNLAVTTVPTAATADAYLQPALDGLREGHVIPYAMELLATGEVIGSTRFWKLDRVNRKVEIGHTWIAKSWQRTFVNTENKYLMLRYAFEDLGLLRVQFQTDELNEASRAAILRLGAKQEGILRKERIMPNGRVRNSVRFSITDDEWPEVKAKLGARLAA